jgi:hypothetical protein
MEGKRSAIALSRSSVLKSYLNQVEKSNQQTLKETHCKSSTVTTNPVVSTESHNNLTAKQVAKDNFLEQPKQTVLDKNNTRKEEVSQLAAAYCTALGYNPNDSGAGSNYYKRTVNFYSGNSRRSSLLKKVVNKLGRQLRCDKAG